MGALSRVRIKFRGKRMATRECCERLFVPDSKRESWLTAEERNVLCIDDNKSRPYVRTAGVI